MLFDGFVIGEQYQGRGCPAYLNFGIAYSKRAKSLEYPPVIRTILLVISAMTTASNGY